MNLIAYVKSSSHSSLDFQNIEKSCSLEGWKLVGIVEGFNNDCLMWAVKTVCESANGMIVARESDVGSHSQVEVVKDILARNYKGLYVAREAVSVVKDARNELRPTILEVERKKEDLRSTHPLPIGVKKGNVIRRLPPRDVYDSADVIQPCAPLLKQVVSDFLRERNLKPNTVKDYEKRLFEVADWMDLPVDKISRKMCLDRHKSLKDRGEYHANLCLKVLRSVLSFAGDRYESEEGTSFVPHNPVEILKELRRWKKPERRKTLIKPFDMPAWWRAVHAHSNRTLKDYLLLLVLTGLRKNEAATLRWSDVDLENRMVSLAKTITKNCREHILPLPKYLSQILAERRSYLGNAGFVFPGAVPGKPISPHYQTYKDVIESCGVKFSAHDLRRTFASTGAECGLDIYTLKRLLNHAPGADVTFGYLIYDVEKLREPMQRIEDLMIERAHASRISDKSIR